MKQTAHYSYKEITLRVVVHLLWAAFIANAANKFFVADLEHEAREHFYAKIFEGTGAAPDQYRILPLLPLKLLVESGRAFNTAVLIYNVLFGFICLELFFMLGRNLGRARIMTVNALFSLIYIYMLYTGWRPDTLGFVALSTLWVCGAVWLKDVQRDVWLVIGVAVVAWGRADFALCLGVFGAVYYTQNWGVRALLVLIPIATQAVLMLLVYPDATYYSEKVMLLDNLSGYYIIRHPFTYFLLGAFLVFFNRIAFVFNWLWTHYRAFIIIFAGYLAFIAIVGRLNEYRLYLPFWPIMLAVWSEGIKQHEKETRPF